MHRFLHCRNKNIEFQLPHVNISGTNDCGNTLSEAFKRCISFQDVLCCRDFSKIVVASFAHQIKSEYYGVNQYLSIEGISMEHFSAPIQTEAAESPQ